MGFMERVSGAYRALRQDSAIVPLAPQGRPAPKAGYMKDGQSVVFGRWNPALRDSHQDVRLAWDQAAARTIDLIQNSGFVAGLVDQSVANVVGQGLQLSARPDFKALRMTEDQASEWSSRVEERFAMWATRPIDCDAEARKTFGHLQASMYRHWLGFGEIFASLPWKMRVGCAYGTKIKVIPALMCPNKSDMENLVQGVRVDSLGAATHYTFRRKRWAFGSTEDVEIAVRDRFGRPIVIHSFDGMPGQVRGISPMTPVLKVARQFDQLSDATLTAAVIQAVFAAVMESEAPTMDVLRALQTPQEQATGASSPIESWLEASSGWAKSANIDLGVPGRIAHTFPGQKLKFLQSEHPNGQYVDFAEFLLREIARCAGLTYESATGDYSGATYSSVRMATTENFLLTLYRRKNIIAPVCQQIYEAWLEEDIDQGGTPFPGGVDGFLANRSAGSRATWRGAGKPQADGLKTAKERH